MLGYQNTFSIIIPTFNSMKYMEECINSAINQTFTEYNIIIVDSGSTDGTIEYLKALKQPKIIIYTASKRFTIEENWGRFVEIKKNEFLTILGHDDILYPNYLQTINDLINNNPKAGLYQSHFDFIDEKSKIIRACKGMNKQIKPVSFFEGFLRNTIEITATGFVVRSKDYDLLKGIPNYPSLLYADIELWMKVIEQNYLVVSPENCFAFRFHINNTSKSVGPQRQIAFERLVNYLKETCLQNPIFLETLKKYGLFFLNNHVVGSCHKLIYINKKNRNGITMNSIIHETKKSSDILLPNIYFNPSDYTSIKIAKVIDKIPIIRSIFLFWKSLVKRTF